MDLVYQLIALLGGLAMFLYGMRVMGDGLKSCSGGAMRSALAKVTARPALGFILGMFVTCMIQSSHATIVLTVGLVGAGFLTFRQSIGVILGANVGTAITAQIIRLMDVESGATGLLYMLNAENLAPLALIAGIVMIMFVKKSAAKSAGSIAVGFGILFMGLIYMRDAVSGLSDTVGGFLMKLEGNYILGFLTGAGATCVIQSSSAVIGILQSFASSFGLKLCGIVAVILGVNMGDSLSAWLVCRIGAKPEQVRTVTVHVIYNICAALLVTAVLAVGRAVGIIGDGLWNTMLDSGGVANVHGLFRLVPAVLLLPMSGAFARVAEKLVPDKPMDSEEQDIEDNLRELDSHLISNPAVALDQSAHLIGHMADVALHNYEAAAGQFFEYDPKRSQRIGQREALLDRMADATNQYIVSLSPYITLAAHTRTQNFFIKALTCFERIGDLAQNIQHDNDRLRDSGKPLTKEAQVDLKGTISVVSDILTLTTNAFKTDDLARAQAVEPLEEVIDDIIEVMKARHVERLTRGECDVVNGIQMENILQNLERISDQCSDLAIYMLSRDDAAISGQEHQYLHELHHSDNAAYREMFRENYEKYFHQLHLDAQAENQ